MTEAEWLSSTDPNPMLEFLRGKVSEPKLRLFAAACCRRISHLVADERLEKAIILSEQLADEDAVRQELEGVLAGLQEAANSYPPYGAVFQAIWGFAMTARPDPHHVLFWLGINFLANAVAWNADPGAEVPQDDDWSLPPSAYWQESRMAERREQAALARDIFANPFSPAPRLEPACSTPQVLSLARLAYEQRKLPEGTFEPERLVALAGALEEAGCREAELLEHLREAGPHVRGCWAVDLILARK
jgi:hypothetical protein